MDYNSLSHTKWNCNYHVVFAPKYREAEDAFRVICSISWGCG